ncbi:tetratricopeptide repeat protein [Methanospirillum sp. J.3.6.1-F.2.7.3]|uniref:Tetratricopeptide repeat protein n=1 Tax=Methanospirillum purgamenti TaxID=2834276 RepID=A0A8E7EKN7_9EURY|nr:MULTISPECIES: tetratricopeptide repeat protein [Methanospirillum]MDX8551902.1 tetratricopeptide repeat protein [Methanospirillum hungatei]QVV89730.1 tetratricopeptide repeat protein [Methanospirillum sp. J.3.6.1-F.2.7.3]
MEKLSFTNNYNNAIVALKSNNFNEALLLIEKCLEIDHENYKALHAKGLILKKLDQFEEASKCYQLSIKYCDDSNKREKLIFLKSELDSLVQSTFFDDLIDVDYYEKYSEIRTGSNIEKDPEVIDTVSLTNNEVEDLVIHIQELLDSDNYFDSIELIERLLNKYVDSDNETLINDNVDQIYVAKAFALSQLGENADIEILLQKSLEINPKNEQAKELLKQIHPVNDYNFKSGEPQIDNAKKELKPLKKLQKKSSLPISTNQIDENHLNSENTVKKDITAPILKKLPSNNIESITHIPTKKSLVWYNKGRVELERNNEDLALVDFNKAIDADPNNYEAWTYRGISLGVLGHNEESIESLHHAIMLYPKYDFAWFSLGVALYMDGKCDEAIEKLNQANKINPEFIPAWFNKGMILGEIEKFQESLEVFNKIITIDPNNADALFFKGMALGSLERHQESLEAFNKAISINPKNADIWYRKGMTLGALEKYQEALEAFNKVISLESKNADAFYQKGLSLLALERHQESLEAFNKSISINPKNADAFYQKGLSLGVLERYQEALEAFNRALSIDSNNVDAWFYKGNTLFSLCEYENALNVYDIVIKKNPNNANALCFKGFSLSEIGRYEEALDAIDKAIKIDPMHFQSCIAKGAILNKLGRSHEAIKVMENALKENPENEALQNMLDVLIEENETLKL